MNTGIQEDFKLQLIKRFEAIQASGATGVHLSKDSFEKFLQSGVPNIKNEEWKYTNIEPALRFDYALPMRTHQATKFSESHFVLPIKCHKLVFVNGLFDKQQSDILEDDAIHLSLFNETETQILTNNKSFNLLPDNGWKYLNEAIIQEGISLSVKKNKKALYPIHIIHITDGSERATLIQYRHLIHLESNAEAQIIESYFATNTGATLTNCCMQVQLDRDARFIHYKIQDVHHGDAANHLINYTAIWQDENASSKQFTFSLSGVIIRNNLHIQLAGRNSEALLYGLYTPHRHEVIDNHTLVDHAVSNCYSNELYKGIADDASKAVFNGKILVRKDAQKTNAFQSNKNLVLTQQAAVYTKPQLEIFADDVKCSHGATSGQLDEEALFYLKARAIPELEARKMLMFAFAEDITSGISDDALRLYINKIIEQKLA